MKLRQHVIFDNKKNFSKYQIISVQIKKQLHTLINMKHLFEFSQIKKILKRNKKKLLKFNKNQVWKQIEAKNY